MIKTERHIRLETVTELLARLERELERGAPLCVLVDARHSRRFELPQVRAFSEFGHAHALQLATWVRAIALIVPSTIVRSGLRLAFQLNPPPHPVEVCETKAEATRWLEPYLAQIG